MGGYEQSGLDEGFGPPVPKKKPEFTFAQIPDWITRNGLLVHMGKNDLKLLIYLCSVRYRLTGNSSRSRKTIYKMTGIPIRQISETSSRLEGMNVITKWRNGNRTFYNVRTKPPDEYDPTKIQQICIRKERTHIQRDEQGMFQRKDGQPNVTDFDVSD